MFINVFNILGVKIQVCEQGFPLLFDSVLAIIHPLVQVLNVIKYIVVEFDECGPQIVAAPEIKFRYRESAIDGGFFSIQVAWFDHIFVGHLFFSSCEILILVDSGLRSCRPAEVGGASLSMIDTVPPGLSTASSRGLRFTFHTQSRQTLQPGRRVGGQDDRAPAALPGHKPPIADLSVN